MSDARPGAAASGDARPGAAASGDAPDLAGVDAALTDVAPAPGASAAAVPGPAPAAAPASPAIEAPSPDVEAGAASARVPGSPHFTYLPTGPVPVSADGPAETGTVAWEPEPPAGRRAVVGPWALGLAIAALAGALVVGWLVPLGITAVVAAIVALRRPVESRGVGWWALALGLLSLAYSAGWLLWAVPQLPGA